MMEAYGNAVVAERTRLQRHAELAAYVRWEYGRGTGPEFLLAEVANGAAGPPRRSRISGSLGVLNAVARAMRALVAGTGADRRAESTGPTR